MARAFREGLAPDMDAALFRRFTTIARERAGIHLRPGKEGLVAARVAKRIRALSLDSPRKYLELLETDDGGHEIHHFLDAISTNFTSFFREPEHFDLLRHAARGWVERGQRRLRVWSAASSSGEEPYSIAMTLDSELSSIGIGVGLGASQVDFKILATDISHGILDQARAATYPTARAATVPDALRRRYFTASAPGELRVVPALTAHVSFRHLNLSAPPFPMRGPFDAIFCRNVLIYFEQPVRQRLITAIEGLLRPGGLLCIGHTETLTGIHSRLRISRPSIFFLPDTDGDAEGPTAP